MISTDLKGWAYDAVFASSIVGAGYAFMGLDGAIGMAMIYVALFALVNGLTYEMEKLEME
jgi:hypothetical protein